MNPKHSSLSHISLMLKNIYTGIKTRGTLGDLMLTPPLKMDIISQ